MLFYLPQDSGYVSQKHDVTNAELKSILLERDVVVKGELKTNRWDVNLVKFFHCGVQGQSHPQLSWREAKRNLKKNHDTVLINISLF